MSITHDQASEIKRRAGVYINAAIAQSMDMTAVVTAQAELHAYIDGLVDPGAAAARDELPDSATRGMTLGERIAHVGGRENAQGYIEFGSPMAVDALIRHVLRDLAISTPQGAFQARYRVPGGEWSSWGAVICGVKGHEQELRYLATESQPSGNFGELQKWLLAAPRKAEPSGGEFNRLSDSSLDYLRRIGAEGSPLRDAGAEDQA